MIVIPQTVEQALQRDGQHKQTTPADSSPAIQLQQLRNAVLEHQATIETAGDLGRARDLSAAQRRIMKQKHDADRKLWAHVHPAETAKPVELEPEQTDP